MLLRTPADLHASANALLVCWAPWSVCMIDPARLPRVRRAAARASVTRSARTRPAIAHLAFLLQFADLLPQSRVLRLQRGRRLGRFLRPASAGPTRSGCPDPVPQRLRIDPRIGGDRPDRRLRPRLVQRDRVRLELRRVVLQHVDQLPLRPRHRGSTGAQRGAGVATAGRISQQPFVQGPQLLLRAGGLLQIHADRDPHRASTCLHLTAVRVSDVKLLPEVPGTAGALTAAHCASGRTLPSAGRRRAPAGAMRVHPARPTAAPRDPDRAPTRPGPTSARRRGPHPLRPGPPYLGAATTGCATSRTAHRPAPPPGTPAPPPGQSS